MANYNNVNDFTFSDEDNDEPLSKEEVKDWLRIDGNSDNNIVENLISAARVVIENYLNQSLINRTISVHLNNSCGNICLPFQPFTELVSIKDADDNTIDSYLLSNSQFRRLQYPCDDGIKVEYKAGPGIGGSIPKVIHTAMLMQISFMYENRGDAEVGKSIAPMAKSILKSYRR